MEGEHTIIGKIPRERLNQIASRKLSGLGVPVRLGADRETLEGLGRMARLRVGLRFSSMSASQCTRLILGMKRFGS